MGMPVKSAADGFALIKIAGGDLLGLFIGKLPNAFSFGLRFVLDVVKLLCHSDFLLNYTIKQANVCCSNSLFLTVSRLPRISFAAVRSFHKRKLQRKGIVVVEMLSYFPINEHEILVRKLIERITVFHLLQLR